MSSIPGPGRRLNFTGPARNARPRRAAILAVLSAPLILSLTNSSAWPAGPCRRAGVCWWPHPPAPARPSWASSPSTWRFQRGLKAFYTTPIKALSNQKYSELAEKYGPANVGLLTGDTSINGEAPVVVMTTEVLRNMLYADSGHPGRPRLRGDGRGPLPRGPLPWCRLGGSHHPPAQRSAGGFAERHRLQRRGVRRLAGHRPGPHRRHRLRAPAGAAVAARHGGPGDRGPFRRRNHLRRDRPRRAGTGRQPVRSRHRRRPTTPTGPASRSTRTCWPWRGPRAR